MIEDTRFNESHFETLAAACPTEFEDCEFSGIRFADINLKSSQFINCTFKNCNFAGQDFLNSSFRDLKFIQCNLMGLNWAALKKMDNCSFTDCKLDLSTFQGRKLKHFECIECSAKEVDFSDADLTESDFSGTTLESSSFTRANLTKANLKTAKSYFIDPQFTKVNGAKLSFPEAISLLHALGVEIDF